ncbi:MAG: hypothetical protein ABI304_03590 [Rudaea sp.]
MTLFRGTEMAKYVNGRKIEPVQRGWNTLDELREFAISHGCTPAQFAYAVEVMGTDTHHVANYLQRHLFLNALPTANVQAA